MTRLNEEQVSVLLRAIKPSRVMIANGQSHVPAYDVAAHLTRILGFGGWDSELLSKELLFEDYETRERTKDGHTTSYKVWTVGYSSTVRLIIKDTTGREVAHWENGACGDAINQPSRADAHHLAMTTAMSTALKRCAAFGLGDQFGLSLYNRGSQSALVGKTLVMPGGIGTPEVDLESHIAAPESLGNDERQMEVDVTRTAPEARETNLAPSEETPTTLIQEPNPNGPSQKQMDFIRSLCDDLGYDPYAKASIVLAVEVTSLRALSKTQSNKLVDSLIAERDGAK